MYLERAANSHTHTHHVIPNPLRAHELPDALAPANFFYLTLVLMAVGLASGASAKILGAISPDITVYVVSHSTIQTPTYTA